MGLEVDSGKVTPARATARRVPLAAPALAVAACLLWFGLGMHRGLLLANNVKAVLAPWAPVYSERTLAGGIVTDPVFQFVPWLELARRDLAAGRLPLWNPYQDGGVPLLANFQSGLGSPLLWPVLAFGTARGWNLTLLLKLLLALVAVYAWLRDERRSAWAAAVGAFAFALSGPFVAWLEHPHTATAAAVPLLLLFGRRVARGWGARDLSALALSTYVVLAGGHPETQLLAAVLVPAMLLLERPRPTDLGRALGGGLIGAGLAAPLLLPFFEYFSLSAARSGADRDPFTLPWRDLLRFVFPRLSGSHPTEAASSVSVTLLLLAAVGLARGWKDRRTLFWAATVVGIVLIVYDNPLSRLLASQTSVYWTRALLFLPLPLVFLGSAGLDALRGRIARSGRVVAADALAALLLVIVLAELIAAAQGAHAVTSARELSPPTPLLSRVAKDGGAFRILPLMTFLVPNTATDYGLEDVRGYDALAPLGWRQRRADLGRFFGRHTDVLRPEGLANGGQALDFWSVKYLLLPPNLSLSVREFASQKQLDLEEVYVGPDGRIWTNRRALPRARLSVAGNARIVERAPDHWVIDADAKSAGELLVANPYFPGWRVKLDGAFCSTTLRPGDPITLSIPPGTHRIELLYRPLSWRLGLGIGAASLVLLLLLSRQAVDQR